MDSERWAVVILREGVARNSAHLIVKVSDNNGADEQIYLRREDLSLSAVTQYLPLKGKL